MKRNRGAKRRLTTPAERGPRRYPFMRNNQDRMVEKVEENDFQQLVKEFRDQHADILNTRFVPIEPWFWAGYTNLRVNSEFIKQAAFDEEQVKTLTELVERLQLDIEELTQRAELPQHFMGSVWELVLNGKITAPAVNFEIGGYPSPERTKFVTLRIYGHQSTQEKNKMLALVEGIMKSSSPEYIHDKRKAHRNLPKKLAILTAAQTRTKPTKTETYDSEFLEIMSKQLRLGQITQEQFDEAKKARKQHVKLVRHGGRSYKNVAEEQLGSSRHAAAIRQTVYRNKREKNSVTKK